MTERRGGPLRVGAASGAAAFLVGHLVTTFLVRRADTHAFVEVDFAGPPERLTFGDFSAEGLSVPARHVYGGWTFHDAHLATIDVHAIGGALDTSHVTFLAPPVPVVYVVPLLLVGAAGYVAARRRSAEDWVEAAWNGAHVVVGYGILATASVGLLSWSGEIPRSASAVHVQPDPLTAILVTGLLYPVLVGGLGGIVQYRAPSRDSDRPDS